MLVEKGQGYTGGRKPVALGLAGEADVSLLLKHQRLQWKPPSESMT